MDHPMTESPPTFQPSYGEQVASADFLTFSSFINVTAAAASTYPVANAGPAGANAYLAVLMNDTTGGVNATIPPFPEVSALTVKTWEEGKTGLLITHPPFITRVLPYWPIATV
jgi:hypothetical protein